MFLLLLEKEAIWTGVFYQLNSKTTQCQNHFDTNLIEIYSVVIEILSISCFVLFQVMADGGHIGMPNCKKKIKLVTYKDHCDRKLI